MKKVHKFLVSVPFLLVMGIGVKYGYQDLSRWPIMIDESYQEREYKGKVVAWIPYWDSEEAFKSVKDNKEAVDILGLFWYVARPDGSIKKYEYAKKEKQIIDWARANNKKIMAIVTNLPEEENTIWDDKLVDRLIGSLPDQRRHVAEIVKLVESQGYDGVQIDYEALRDDQRTSFTSFIRLLGEELHGRGKLLGVDLLAKKKEGDPADSNGSEAQDWRLLARYADHLYLMVYGQHWDTSGPGPMAGLPWFTAVVNYARQMIPADKLFVGMPLYGYDWGGAAEARGLTHKEGVALIEKHKVKVRWNETEGSRNFVYEDKGIKHEVWFEEATSIRAKVDLLKGMGVRNVAVWRLGGEDKGIWPQLLRF